MKSSVPVQPAGTSLPGDQQSPCPALLQPLPRCAQSQAGTSPVLAKGTRFWRVALLSEQGQSPLELQLHLECQADNWWASNVPVVFVPAVPKVKGTSVFCLSKHDCTKGKGWIVLLAPQK